MLSQMSLSILIFSNILVLVVSNQCHGQSPPEKYSLIVFAGEDSKLNDQLKATVTAAISIEGMQDIHVRRSNQIDRIICIYDAKHIFSEPEKTIKSIVDSIPASQTLFFHRDANSKLTDDDLLMAANLIPWDIASFRSEFQFYRDFEDPLRLTTHHSQILDDRTFLGFTSELNGEGPGVQYWVSTSLLSADKTERCHLTVFFFDPNQLLRDIELREFLEELGAEIGKKTVFLVGSNRPGDSPCQRFLREWAKKKVLEADKYPLKNE